MLLDLETEHRERSQPAVWSAESKDAVPVEIRQITDPAGLDKVVQVEDAVWNESHAWIADELGRELVLPGEPLLMYLAYAEGVPAAAAWIRFHAGTDFAALFGGSTLPQYRKRGLYTTLLNVRAQAALERGYRFLSVDASEMSRPILEKHGFVKVTTATAYKYRVPGSAS
jgi:GNAT superfamily N-acetyltransferase